MTETSAEQPVPFLRRVRIRNYRSIASCDVTLGPLTVLLGFNASGKTNFLDALRFVADALAHSPIQAVADRGDLEHLLHRSAAGTADSFEIWLDLRLGPMHGSQLNARYGFEIGRDPAGEAPLLVLREVCEFGPPDGVVRPSGAAPAPQARLRLPASAVDKSSTESMLEARLTSMRFYDFDTAALAALEERRRRQYYWLGQAGEHLGRVLDEIESFDSLTK